MSATETKRIRPRSGLWTAEHQGVSTASAARLDVHVSRVSRGGPRTTPRERRAADPAFDPLRIAVLAPPWIPVPPPAYGGIEAVVNLLCEALVARGHDVTLFAAPGSRSPARVRSPLEAAQPNKMGSSLYESDHVASAWDEIDQAGEHGKPFDLIHDHSGFTALAMADRVGAPVVHTLHGQFDHRTNHFYQRHGHKARLIAVSRSQAQSAPPGVLVADVVPNPIAMDRWPLRTEKQDYLLWVGRMHPSKGAHRAIEAARLAGRRLMLAGPIQPGQERYYEEQVQPHIDGRAVRYLGEVGGRAKQELFANAAGFLMPVRWREPFGMVMIEALACGTPVIAFPEGAASEIVLDHENGFMATNEIEMARAVDRLGSIDPARCRASVAERYDIRVIAGSYERVYREAIATARRDPAKTADSMRGRAAMAASVSR